MSYTMDKGDTYTRGPLAAINSNMRACSDCEEYAQVSSMTRTPAGNMVCAKCAKRRDKIAAERAQLSFFGQEELFT